MMFEAVSIDESETMPDSGYRAFVPSLLQLQLLHQLSQRQLAEAIIRQYRKKLFQFLKSKVYSAADADDLLQDICVKISNSQRLGLVNNIESYVFAIAKNLIRDKYRRSAKNAEKQPVAFDSLELADESANPHELFEGVMAVKDVLQQIDSLTPRCKQAFLMRSIEGKSYKAIALEMGISLSMVEKHVGRALQVMRENGSLL